MTHHLTDEQLGTTRDGALSAKDAAAVERHLAGCAACGERLAELASLDAELAGALEHDPGEAYFASFADRVGDRIAGAAALAAPAEPRRGFTALWGSPRAIAWAGGALGLVAVAALVVTLAREHGPQELVRQAAPARELGANAQAPRAVPPRAGLPRDEARADRAPAPPAEAGGAPAPSGTRAFAASPPPTASPAAPVSAAAPAGQADQATARAREEVAAQPKTQAENAAPGRVMEVRTLPSGEQEIVTRGPQTAPAPAPPALKTPFGFSKPAASPLGGQPLTRQSLAGDAAPAAGALERKAAASPSAGTAPALDALGGQPMRDSRAGGTLEAAPGVAVCGQVLDTHGRPAAGALVVVAGTGRTATAGADGSFCVNVPEAGSTLSVLAVGYRASRVSVLAENAASPVSITLAAVDVLAPSTKRETGVYNYTGEPARRAADGSPSMARRTATAASAAALRAGSADAWTLAAERWETVALLEPASSAVQPGFRAAEARVNAWLVGRDDPKRAVALRAAARAATQAYVDRGTDAASLEIARGWQLVLEH